VVGALTLIFAGVYFTMLLALSSPAVGTRYRWFALLVAAGAVSPPTRCDAGSATPWSGVCSGNAGSRSDRWHAWTH
jgi:hypothetical protein